MKKAVIIIIILFNIPILLFFAVRIVPKMFEKVQAAQPQAVLKGVQSVQIAEGCDIIIEAPCEYQLPYHNQLNLNYGKAYGSIPPECVGAVISSPIAACVVLGESEFGIIVHVNGRTEVHVSDGDIHVMLPAAGAQRASMLISDGQALLVAPNGTIKNTPLDMNQFKKTPTPPENPESTEQQPKDSQPSEPST